MDPKYALVLRHVASRCVTEGHATSRAEILAVWVWIIDFSSQNEQRGSVDGIDPAQISVTLDIPDEIVKAILSGFEFLGMVSGKYLKSWDKRQPKREDPHAERQKEYRDRKKQSVTQRDAIVTQRDAVTPSRERPRDLLSSSSIPTNKENPSVSNNGSLQDSGADWFEEIYTRHPKKKDRGMAAQYLSQVTIDRAEFDRVHKLCCVEWAKEKANFAPSLAQWILDQGWKYPPNGNGNGNGAAKPSGCPVCNVTPCECFKRRLAKGPIHV